MAPIAQQIADMVDMLPEKDQALAFELVKKLVLDWDPDFSKVTPAEKAEIDKAAAEQEAGEHWKDQEPKRGSKKRGM